MAGRRPLDLARSLDAADRLALVSLSALAALAAVTDAAPLGLLLLMGALAAILAGIAGLAARSVPWARVHDFASPYVAIVSVFELATAVIERRGSARWDRALAQVDARWFASVADHWHRAFGRPSWLTDLASVAYVAFYALPLIVGIAVYRRRPRRDFDQFVFRTEIAFFASYVGYLAFPAAGPRLPAESEAQVLGGGVVSAGIRTFVRAVELSKVDAFPSGHTLVSLVVLASGWRLLPRWRLPLSAVVTGIVFATVYLQFHYVVDVAAGALGALAIAIAGPFAERARTALESRRSAARSALLRAFR